MRKFRTLKLVPSFFIIVFLLSYCEDQYEAIDELDNTEYEMLVVEPGFNFIDFAYDTEYLVSALKYRPGGEERILLVYIDIGQAEDYRSYRGSHWVEAYDDDKVRQEADSA